MNSDKEQTLNIDQYLALWQHHEEHGNSCKDRMVTAVSWMLGFEAALLAYLATNGDLGAGRTIATAMIGLCLSALSVCLVIAYAGYAKRAFKIADRLERKVPELRLIRADTGGGWRSPIFRRVGIIFDVFLFFAVGAGALFLHFLRIALDLYRAT